MEIFLYLFIGSFIYLIGAVVFGRFEIGTPLPRRLGKVVFFHAFIILLYALFGGIGAIAWTVAMFGVGLTFHFWWCNRNEIHPIKAEPRERYYELRGWVV